MEQRQAGVNRQSGLSGGQRPKRPSSSGEETSEGSPAGVG